MTITGTNFVTGAGNTTVTFGGTAATSVNVASATSLTCTTPAHAAGAVNVVVTTDGGTATSANGFTYTTPAPTVTGLNPTGGPIAGGTAVTITGTNLTGATAVSFGGTAATGVSVVNATTVTCTSPAHAAGTVDVTVTTPGGTSSASGTGNDYTYTAVAAPTVTALNPTGGTVNGGTVVTITGTNLTGATAVSFGGTGATNVAVVNATTITCKSPAHAAGTIDVTVTTPGGTSSTSGTGNNYAYAAPAVPTVTNVNPNTGPAIGGTSVTITGTGFTGAYDIFFGDAQVLSGTIVNDTTITVSTPPHSAATVDVTVTTPGGTSSTSGTGNDYTYTGQLLPEITSIVPNSGNTAGGYTVTITGTGLATVTDVYFGTTASPFGSHTGDTEIVATVPAHAAGKVDVTAVGPGGTSPTAGTANDFTFADPPTISNVNPNSGSTAGGTNVTITGTNFIAGATVTFGGTAATSINVASATSITCTTPAHAAGAVNVVVTTSVGTATSNNGFTYVTPPVPTVTALNPTSGSTAGGTAVTITGTNLTGATAVSFGGTAATGVSVVNATTVNCTSPAHAAGTVDVTVTTPGGTSSTSGTGNDYTYNQAAPTITTIAPTSGSTVGGTNVTITGTNFIAGATVTFGGTAATSINVASATSITCTTPAHAAGAVNVVVTTSGGTATSTNGFTYNQAAPTITTIAPTSGSTVGGTNVTITGTNFIAGATVTFGGTAATSINVASATSITCTTPAHAAGAVNVVVTTSGGTATSTNGFTYVAPVVTTRYEQTDPSLTYAGTWGMPSNAGASGGSWTNINATGSVTVNFTGTAISWINVKSPYYGIAKVTLDGGAAVFVDLYSPTVSWQQAVWSATGLSGSGIHTVKIEWTNTKNAAALAAYIGVDAFDVTGTLVALNHYEETNANLAFTGSWSSAGNSGASASAWKYLNSAGSVTVDFTGTAISWINVKSPNYGIAQVSLDGGAAVDVDLYSATTSWQQKVWSATGLSNGAHTVTITWTGTKNALAAATNIGVDAFDVTGTLVALNHYEETNANLAFTGSWSSAGNSGASASAWKYLNSAGSVTVDFTGTAISWINVKSPNYGIAQVSLDGGAAVDVDLYSATTSWQQKVWSATGLSNGAHTVTITWTGTKNALAAATNIGVDAFDIRGTIAP